MTEQTRQRVAALVKADPQLTAAEIGRQVGVSRERVRQILNDLGYELRQQWHKKSHRKGSAK